MKSDLTQARLHELLDYNELTGEMTRRVALSNRVKVGDVAGYTLPVGYRFICVDGQTYYAHRLVWLHVHGRWPDDQIDHANGRKGDNRLCNLREASKSQNQQNLAMRASNTSGKPGVCWSKQKRKWQADIRHEGKRHCLGHFESVDEAHAAYLAAKERLHTFQPTIRQAA